MDAAKKRIIETTQELPEDSSYEEILRELAFRRMIERGLEDSKAKKTISNKEMKHRIKTW